MYYYIYNYVHFIVPKPLVQITVFDNETLTNQTLRNLTIGDPLTLDCTVTAVRGISSSVDIIWTTGGRVVRRVYNITADVESDSAIYTDSFEISSLSAIDNGREYQCIVVINANPSVISKDRITLIFPGELYITYVCMPVMCPGLEECWLDFKTCDLKIVMLKQCIHT